MFYYVQNKQGYSTLYKNKRVQRNICHDLSFRNVLLLLRPRLRLVLLFHKMSAVLLLFLMNQFLMKNVQSFLTFLKNSQDQVSTKDFQSVIFLDSNVVVSAKIKEINGVKRAY